MAGELAAKADFDIVFIDLPGSMDISGVVQTIFNGPRWIAYCVYSGTVGVSPPTPSYHRLQHGLPGYLILFAPHAFVPQRQLKPSRPPSPLVFSPVCRQMGAEQGRTLSEAEKTKNKFNLNN